MTTTTGTREDLPLAVQKLIFNLRQEVKDYKRMRGDAVREMQSLRREAVKHRVARNAALELAEQLRIELREAQAEIASLRTKLEARGR